MSIASQTQTWTYAELDKLPESENGDRYEIIEGELVVTPSSIPFHQGLSMELTFVVGPFVRSHRLGRIFAAPVDILLDERVVLVPDFVFVARDRLHIIGPKAIEGPPDLVVEILSPGTRARDLGVKIDLYARFGIREYWVLEPRARTLTIYALAAGSYEVVPNINGIARSRVLPGLAIDIAALSPRQKARDWVGEPSR